jgi:putative endonuclease
VTAVRQARGAAARLSGRRAEVWAALYLMCKGYRILGFRLKSAAAEIDLLALKGKTLVVVEVKQRTNLAAAIDAVGVDQRERLRRAARAIAARRPGLKDAAVRLDLIALAPGHWPRHIADAWRFDEHR